MTRQHTAVFGWVVAVLVAALFCALGGWQLQRMQQKEALLAQLPPSRDAALSLAQALVPLCTWGTENMAEVTRVFAQRAAARG